MNLVPVVADSQSAPSVGSVNDMTSERDVVRDEAVSPSMHESAHCRFVIDNPVLETYTTGPNEGNESGSRRIQSQSALRDLEGGRTSEKARDERSHAELCGDEDENELARRSTRQYARHQ